MVKTYKPPNFALENHIDKVLLITKRYETVHYFPHDGIRRWTY